jgi:hypothetical protein
MNGFINDLIAFTSRLKKDSLPAEALKRVTDAIADTFGCIVLGHRQELAQKLFKILFPINANNKNWKSPEFIKKIKMVASNTMKKLWADPEHSRKFKEVGSKAFEGKTHTEQTKKSIGQKNSLSQKGESNSQFGTCWITNGTENKKIRKDSSIPTGWWNGRKQKPDLT